MSAPTDNNAYPSTPYYSTDGTYVLISKYLQEGAQEHRRSNAVVGSMAVSIGRALAYSRGRKGCVIIECKCTSEPFAYGLPRCSPDYVASLV